MKTCQGVSCWRYWTSFLTATVRAWVSVFPVQCVFLPGVVLHACICPVLSHIVHCFTLYSLRHFLKSSLTYANISYLTPCETNLFFFVCMCGERGGGTDRQTGWLWVWDMDAIVALSDLTHYVGHTGLELRDLPVSVSQLLGLGICLTVALEVFQHWIPRLAVVAIPISCFVCCRVCGWNWLQTTRRWNGGSAHGLAAPS